MRTDALFRSLVGSSIGFSFSSNTCSLENTISKTKKKISKDVEIALNTGGKLCVMLLSELTSFYAKENYYMAIRSCIEMRRYRPLVLDYLDKSVDERSKILKKSLSENPHTDKNREIKVSALKYFLSIYPSRIKEFKDVLTKEEILFVS